LLQNIPLLAERVEMKNEHIDAVIVDLMANQRHLGKIFKLRCGPADTLAPNLALSQSNCVISSYNYALSHPSLCRLVAFDLVVVCDADAAKEVMLQKVGTYYV